MQVPSGILLLVLLTLCGCATQESDYQRVQTKRLADPGAARALSQSALAALDAGELQEAEDLLERSLAADVGFGPAHNNLGKVCFQQGELYRAAWEFEYAIKLMPHHPEPRNNLALVLETVRRFDEAVSHYEAALNLEPDNAELIGNLARARLRRGDTPEQVKPLLMDLLLKDSRLEWVEWAERELAKTP